MVALEVGNHLVHGGRGKDNCLPVVLKLGVDPINKVLEGIMVTGAIHGFPFSKGADLCAEGHQQEGKEDLEDDGTYLHDVLDVGSVNLDTGLLCDILSRQECPYNLDNHGRCGRVIGHSTDDIGIVSMSDLLVLEI